MVVWLADHSPDGATTYLAMGQLRLRYREGFDRERLLVGGSNFPLLDPNPHVDGPIATASEVRNAVQTVFHDASRPSRLLLPTIG